MSLINLTARASCVAAFSFGLPGTLLLFLVSARLEKFAILRAIGDKPWPGITSFAVYWIPDHWWVLCIPFGIWAITSAYVFLKRGKEDIAMVLALGNSLAFIVLGFIYVAVRAPTWSISGAW
jgi:hypothetical protein